MSGLQPGFSSIPALPQVTCPQNSLLEPPNAQLCNRNNHLATCRAVGFVIPRWPFSFLVDTGTPGVLEEWDWRDTMTVT